MERLRGQIAKPTSHKLMLHLQHLGGTKKNNAAFFHVPSVLQHIQWKT